MARTDTHTGTGAAPRTSRYLTFWLGSDLFAMDIETVHEIIQPGPLTPVPLMPDFLCGMMNLRGAVVPVVDLQARFGHRRGCAGKKSCIVVFDALQQGEPTRIGLMVDAVSEVVELDAPALQPPPDFGSAVRRDYLLGMARMGERFVMVLDPDRTVDIDEMSRQCAEHQDALAA